MNRRVRLIVAMLAAVSIVAALSLGAQTASAAMGLIGGQYGSEDFTNLEHLASLDSLESSWGEGDGHGQQWSGEWHGSIAAPASGNITFQAESDQDVQILIAGRQVVAANKGKGAGSMSMSKGKKYPIEVRFVKEGSGYDCQMKIQWSWAGQATASIGSENLSYTSQQETEWSAKADAAEAADDEDEDDGDEGAGHDDDGDTPVVAFKYQPTGLKITIGGKPFASYFTGSTRIPRPYFANVTTPSGVQVSRNHPPVEGKDSTDHDTYHPGLWLTFAGINGNDYWRLKKKTEHEMFIAAPESGPGKGTFTVSNFYLDSKDSTGNRIAHEVCKYTILVRENYYLLIYDSTISSDKSDLAFGDDQEYGLGIRVQTPIEERYGGQILNADGLKGAKKAYGKASNWADYSGVMDNTLIGMTVMPDPKNIRPSWYHTRDYGLIAANLFGSKKVAGLARNDIKVKKGEKFHLGFGIAIYSAAPGAAVDRDAMYKDYLKAISK